MKVDFIFSVVVSSWLSARSNKLVENDCLDGRKMQIRLRRRREKENATLQ